VYDCEDLKSTELLRKLNKLAKQNGIPLTITPAKGSHRKVHYGSSQTILPMHHSELKTGLLKAILKDLGISEEEL
jgi:mRNA interferase HicA